MGCELQMLIQQTSFSLRLHLPLPQAAQPNPEKLRPTEHPHHVYSKLFIHIQTV